MFTRPCACRPSTRPSPLDNKAATLQLEKKEWADIEHLFGQAEAAWGEAARDCKGDSRASALSNQADSARARARAASFMGEGAACDPAFADASRMLDLAKLAWSERQWEDAALWYRKAEMAWGMAVERCAGPKREQALKKKDSAVMDAHNAMNCAPLWEKATGLSAKFKALPTAATPAEKAPLHDQVEVAWSKAALTCRGAPQEKARAYADAFARERGNVPLSVASAPKSLPAVPEGAVADAPGAESVVKVPENTAVMLSLPSAPVPQEPSRGAIAETHVQGSMPTSEASGQIPVVNLKAGNTTFSGRFNTDPSRLTVSGEGKVQWDNGNVFTGTLVQGRAEGRGSMRWSNGDTYEGDWKNDLQQGKGSMTYANGDRFEGDFVAGYPAGRGRYLFAASGDRYEGEVRQGKPEGRGTYLWKNGDRYEGGWKDGMKSGAGRYTWVSGEVQDGQYANDQRIAPSAAK